jgi:hypothetical protein
MPAKLKLPATEIMPEGNLTVTAIMNECMTVKLKIL